MDLVRAGLSAQVRLLPYKQRRTPPLDARVTYVSADRLVDKQTNQPYYVAKLEVDAAVLAKLDGVEMLPGMPAEVVIATGKTTVALYALSPILDSFNRAFREK
jgi:HlyD family secretion protein